jgi:hypothetical protein
MKNFKIISLLTSALLITPVIVFAQPPLPGPVSAPLDGGISIVLLTGAGLAVKKIWKK